MRHPARVVVLAVALLVACSAPAAPAPPSGNGDVVVRYPVAGDGSVMFTTSPEYAVGETAKVRVDITAGSVPIRGPVSGRVIDSSMAGESIMHTFTAAELASVDVAPRQHRTVSLSWVVAGNPTEAYSVMLEFAIGTETRTFGALIQVRPV